MTQSCHNAAMQVEGPVQTGNCESASGVGLLEWFHCARQVTVAFSGGVDSALVLAAAARALGCNNVHAVTAVSDSLPGGMLSAAHDLAALLRVRHTELPTREIDNPGYLANGDDRCYFCKATLLDAVIAAGYAEGGRLVVTGTNADDVAAGWRPGIRAAAERQAGTPLADVGMDKDAVRSLSRAWKLPTWDRPASPCLSSRIAYGIRITPYRLSRVDTAEQAVRAALQRAGMSPHNLRVRDLGDWVRIELDADLVATARDNSAVTAAVSRAGFGTLPVEIGPFRSGSLNAAVPGHLKFS